MRDGDLRVKDGTVGRDTTAVKTVDQLLGQTLVGDDPNGLCIEFLDHLQSKLDQIRLSVFASVYRMGASALEQLFESVTIPTVENCVGGITQNLIDEFVAESLADVRGSPEQADWDTTLKNSVGTWTNTGTSSD